MRRLFWASKLELSEGLCGAAQFKTESKSEELLVIESSYTVNFLYAEESKRIFLC